MIIFEINEYRVVIAKIISPSRDIIGTLSKYFKSLAKYIQQNTRCGSAMTGQHSRIYNCVLLVLFSGNV
jgi:hypothetical protein